MLSVDEADLNEMAADIGMKKPHAKMLLRGWKPTCRERERIVVATEKRY